MAELFYTPTSNTEEFRSLHVLASVWCCHSQCRRSGGFCVGCVHWCLIMALICICPLTNAVEHIFMYLLAIHNCSFGKCLFKSVAHVKIGLLDYSFWILVFCQRDGLQIFFPSSWLACSFSNGIFWWAKVCNFNFGEV